MRSWMLGGAAVAAMLAATGAGAQVRVAGHGPGAGFPPPGARPMPGPRPGMATPANRWGSKVNGRWWGGANAPGGWNAYRRPLRGWALPTYWSAPRFYVSDWSSYGLAQPPAGYGWSRYYDDAVLIDARGSVYDSVSGVDWDGGGYAYDDRHDGRAEVYDDRSYDDRRYDDRRYDDRRGSGIGGAVAGAAVGGVAGNLIAGRGNRLGGTLIGAGVGAAAGYAVDRASSRRERVPVAPYPPRAPYSSGYADVPPPPPPPMAHDGPPRPPYPVHEVRGPGSWTSPDGATTVVTTSGGGWYGAGTTTVTVQTQPVVTTTTTVYEDVVTYSRPAVRKVYAKRWVAKPRCVCK